MGLISEKINAMTADDYHCLKLVSTSGDWGIEIDISTEINSLRK
jgi:hypothetical protein